MDEFSGGGHACTHFIQDSGNVLWISHGGRRTSSRETGVHYSHWQERKYFSLPNDDLVEQSSQQRFARHLSASRKIS